MMFVSNDFLCESNFYKYQEHAHRAKAASDVDVLRRAVFSSRYCREQAAQDAAALVEGTFGAWGWLALVLEQGSLVDLHFPCLGMSCPPVQDSNFHRSHDASSGCKSLQTMPWAFNTALGCCIAMGAGVAWKESVGFGKD